MFGPLLEIKHPKYGVMEVFKATKVHIPSISFNEPSLIKQITLSFFFAQEPRARVKVQAAPYSPLNLTFFWNICDFLHMAYYLRQGNPFCTLVHHNVFKANLKSHNKYAILLKSKTIMGPFKSIWMNQNIFDIAQQREIKKSVYNKELFLVWI